MKVHSFRLARRIVSGRRALAGLTGATAALSLLILSLTPHPGPDPQVGGQSVLSHGHQRRIQQEAAGVEDYGEPRRGGYNGSRGADDPLLSEVKVKTVKEEVEAEVEAVVEEEEEAEVVKAKVVDIPKEARAEGAEEEAEDDDHQILSKARETAITALQHGFKLTEGQKRLLERMSPTERQEVESKVSKVLRNCNKRAMSSSRPLKEGRKTTSTLTAKKKKCRRRSPTEATLCKMKPIHTVQETLQAAGTSGDWKSQRSVMSGSAVKGFSAMFVRGIFSHFWDVIVKKKTGCHFRDCGLFESSPFRTSHLKTLRCDSLTGFL